MESPESDSEFVKHLPCPACGSSDANALFTDGHTHCFACGKTVQGDGTSNTTRKERHMSAEFLEGDIIPLPKRHLSLATCQKFGYAVGKNKHGQSVQIATYANEEGEVVAQKLRDASKNFVVVGSGGHSMPLFGQHLWPTSGQRICITEGEIDAMSLSQSFGNSWPVVSLPNGAQAAKKAIARNLQWLLGYTQIVLCFDMDEPGRAAAAECAPLFPPGRCAIAQYPLKDANEMLVAGRVKELVSAVYQARTYRPDGIVTLAEIEERVLAKPTPGRPWPFEGLTKATFGRRPGDVIGLGAGSGVGKSDFLAQCVAYDVMELGVPTATLFLEQAVGETGRRIAGKIAGKRFHVPNDGWTEEELRETWGRLKAANKLHLYDSFGAMDWKTIEGTIRYLAAAEGVQHFYLDHLTALAAAEDDEKKALEKIMAEVASLAQSLGIIIHYVSHLATPEGKPHEEGGRVMAKHFKGSRAIAFWSHLLLGLERDTQNPGSPTVLRCLKDRYTGQATGRTWGLQYNATTGLLSECELPDVALLDEEEHGGRDF